MEILLLIVVNYIHAFQYPLTHLLISTFSHYILAHSHIILFLVFQDMQLLHVLLVGDGMKVLMYVLFLCVIVDFIVFAFFVFALLYVVAVAVDDDLDFFVEADDALV